MRFDDFLENNEYARHSRDLFDEADWNWNETVKRGFVALVYCAIHKCFVTYKALACISAFPERYIENHAFRQKIKHELTIIGYYCDAQVPSLPKLSGLCVLKTAGVASGGFFRLFGNTDADSPLETKLQELNRLCDELKNKDEDYWHKVMQNAGIPDNYMNEKFIKSIETEKTKGLVFSWDK